MTTWPAWQPMATAPKDGTAVLLAVKYSTGLVDRIAASWAERHQPRWIINGSAQRLPAMPTHWMPLPEPPPVIGRKR
mgnify:CR=1 FL=1